MSLIHTWLTRLLALALVVGLGLGVGLAADAPQDPSPLMLDDTRPVVRPWASLGMLVDDSHQLTLAQVRERVATFKPAPAPAGNLGPRHEAIWLRLPLQVANGDGQWVLDIDYPALNDADLYLVTDGRLVQHQHLGATQAFSARPMPTRTHAAPLTLSPGARHELYLRVQTASAMVLPITLNKPAVFHAREAGRQLWHGLVFGVALALLAYSLAHWLSLRNALFGLYALMLLGSTTFFVDYYGIGQQYLWARRIGVTAMISPLSVLVALAAGGLFVANALGTRELSPRIHRGLMGLSLAATLSLVVIVLGGLSYRQAQLVATVLGPLVPLLSIPAAWARARTGNRVGLFMLIGWTSYMLGAAAMAALLRGGLPANLWTQHVFQVCSMVEMLAWLRVLSLHIEAVRRQAERSELEKQALVSLAQTDALTGLPNRRGLSLALEQALAQRQGQRALAIYLLDLDGFKAVNDQHGHDVGDALLVQVGQRLRCQLRHSDVVARLGGDEFVIMAPGLAGEAEACALGHKLLTAFESVFEVQGQACRVGLTIGLALAPEDGTDAETLLKHADRGMYAGKQAGRHTLRRLPQAVPALSPAAMPAR
jgi:diguanylate cyclase (GGDEF)-like protein